MKIFIVILLLFVLTGATAQPTVDSIPVWTARSHQLSNAIGELFQQFCRINANSRDDGSKIIEFASKKLVNEYSISNFYINSFPCMSTEQRSWVAAVLRGSLRQTDPGFFNLVSLYELTQFIPFLEAHVPKGKSIEDRLVNSAKRTKSFREVKYELMCMGALAHFNDSVAVELIDLVNNAQRRVEVDRDKFGIIGFYTFIRQVMANVYRRDVILKTLPLLEVESIYTHNGAYPISYFYFQAVIEPHINIGNIDEWSLMSEDKKVVREAAEKIKSELLNNETIWKDYIIK